MAVVAPSPGAPVGEDAEGDTTITNIGKVGFRFEYPRRSTISTFMAPGAVVYKDGNTWTGIDPTPPAAQGQSVVTASNTKAEIIQWLLNNGVTGVSTLTKAELLDLVTDLLD